MPTIKTERAWLASTTPASLLRTLKGKRLPRQRRLFAVACCRRVLDEMPDPESRRAVEVAELFADGRAGREELDAAFAAAQEVAGRCMEACLVAGSPRQAAAAWNAWRLAHAAQLACARTGMEGASGAVLKRAARLGAEQHLREKQAHSALLRDLFGNPFRPPPVLAPDWLRWNGGAVAKLAQALYEERRFEDAPVLADALEEAGCADVALLGHLRGPGPHARGCWAVDLVLPGRAPPRRASIPACPSSQASRDACPPKRRRHGSLYSTPPFITRRTLRSAVMSRVGSPATATRSASSPGLTAPRRSPRRSTFAATDVAARSAWAGFMP
jgi:hypothetical protein